MNPLSDPRLSRPSSSPYWVWVLLAVLVLPPTLLVYGVTSYFRLSSDTQALRSGLMKASGVEWRRQFSLNVGGLTFGAVRSGLSFVNLPNEARAAAQAIRGVQVSVLRLASGETLPDRAAMLNAADSALSRRGWDRVVGVLEGEALVAVYVSNETTSFRRLECCVVVLEGEQMVVASARANLQPLVDCAFNEFGLREKLRLPSALRTSD